MVWYVVENLWVCTKQKKEGIVTSIVFRTCHILDTNVMLCPNGEDIALVASTNHLPKMWTIHALAYKWPQCNCPLVAQGIICKHVMKIFKMFHPHIPNGAIVRETWTLHGFIGVLHWMSTLIPLTCLIKMLMRMKNLMMFLHSKQHTKRKSTQLLMYVN